MSDDEKKFTNKLRNGGKNYSEEDVAMSVSEDRRLVELGIDPNCSALERMRQVEARELALKKLIESGGGQ